MAHLIPSDPDFDRAASLGHEAEARTLEQLRTALPGDYTVYHGVHWANAQGRGSVYGEIDFVITRRSSPKLLAIEQKSGQVLRVGDDLVVRYRKRSAKGEERYRQSSVTTQVARNLNALRDEYSRRHTRGRLDIDHLLYLPNSRIDGPLPASLDPQRVVDADGAPELADRIHQIFELGSDVRGDELADPLEVHDYLAGKVHAVPDIGVLGRSARHYTTRLSGGLATWARRIEMSPWRLRVQGTAGSGKTQLALDEMKAAHARGLAALYVCFNRPLADAMKKLAPEPANVVSFHELAAQVMASAGQTPDFSQPEVFKAMEAGFIALSPRLADTFHTLVIDEGQDFEPAWAQALFRMVRADGRMLWLEDPEQSLYRREPIALEGWTVLKSPVNYRSPRRLVELMNELALTDEPIEAGSAIEGFDPIRVEYAEGESPIPATEAAIRQLIDDGFAPRNIAVLSLKGRDRSQIANPAGPARLAGLKVRRQIGFDTDQRAVWSEGELLVDTVHRFKGQAADAVVITEMDADSVTAERRRLFVGISRARLQVGLVGLIR